MRRFYYLFILLFLSCGVKQPLDIGQTAIDSGSLFVDSQPPSASIFIDNILQSGLTPDTIDHIPVGRHQIKVFKKGYFSTFELLTVDVKKDSLHSVYFPLEIIEGASSVFVNSEPPGATIFIDGQNTGLQTPDTVDVQSGQHEISARKNGFEDQTWQIDVLKDSLYQLNSALTIFQRVQLEAFGNVACDPCVKSAENLEKFIKENPDGHFVLFEYYTNWPAGNDPFYATAPDDVDERVLYYQAFTLPVLRMNGSATVDAKDYNQIVSLYTAALAAQNSELAISVQKEKTEEQLQTAITLYDRGNVLNNSDLRLFAAVVEDSLYYENNGGNGLTHFNFVFRRFLTSKKGEIINSANFSFTINWPAGWNYSNSKIISFIQNSNTKKIIQTTIN